MNDVKMISRKDLQIEAQAKISKGFGSMNLADFSVPLMGGNFANMNQDQKWKAIERLDHTKMIQSSFANMINHTGKYGSGFDIPVKWGDNITMSTREKLNTGFFNTASGAVMSSNTLPVDWANLWDALRIDVTVRKAALPTIRQFIYNVTNNPNFTRDLNPTEINPFGVVFEENNGHGQAVPQGETLGGGYDTFRILVYAAGFTWDLIAELFDLTITPERLMDAVMVGYNSKRDDLALSPILDFTYAGVQQTAAAVRAGAGRQELLYLTMEDAIDDLGNRLHPVTGRKLNVSNLVVVGDNYDARHIARVTNGLPNTNEEKYPGLSEIRQVLSYDDEVIKLRDRTITYDGATQGVVFLLIPASALPADGYMEIAVKRDLVVEVDSQPDVRTLAREQRAYWYAEGIWYEGIQYFVQEVTLPAW